MAYGGDISDCPGSRFGNDATKRVRSGIKISSVPSDWWGSRFSTELAKPLKHPKTRVWLKLIEIKTLASQD